MHYIRYAVNKQKLSNLPEQGIAVTTQMQHLGIYVSQTIAPTEQ